jgi:hypothetical protein
MIGLSMRDEEIDNEHHVTRISPLKKWKNNDDKMKPRTEHPRVRVQQPPNLEVDL